MARDPFFLNRYLHAKAIKKGTLLVLRQFRNELYFFGPYIYIDGFCNSWYQDFFFVFIIVFVQALNLKECKKKEESNPFIWAFIRCFWGKAIIFPVQNWGVKNPKHLAYPKYIPMSLFLKKFTKYGSGRSKKLPGLGLCRLGNTKFGRVGLRNSILFLFSSRVRKVLALIFNFPQNRLPICFFIPCSSPNADFFFFQIFNF